MRVPILLGLAFLALAACKPPEPTAPQGTPEFIEQQRASCEARGGSFGGSEGKATNVCFITPKDANKACLKGSDCEGQCLARSRSCAPVIPLYGCHEVLLDGGLPATVCLD